MKRRISSAAALLLAAISALYLGVAAAHGTEDHKKPTTKKAISKDEHPWGREGDPKKAVRTVEVDMSDAMRFTPDKLEVKQGDTVKFVVKNRGKVMHEMVIGTEKELKAHAEMMKKHPGMEHEEPYMAHVSPGKREEIVWQFTKPGDFMFGCLIPGHFEAGMVGKITVAALSAKPAAKADGHAGHKH
ncbi:MAG: cupredoxin family protein [Burkholderiales bacterium]|nr:cupredoxin family protein [Burkholderiales bacterium]